MEPQVSLHMPLLFPILLYLFLAVGASLVTVLVWFAKRTLSKLDSISRAQVETNTTLLRLEHRHDHRLTRLETMHFIRDGHRHEGLEE